MDDSRSRVDRACAHQVGNTDCAGWCWEWGGLIPQREGSERKKKGKADPWGQRQVQCHLAYGHVPTCIEVQGKYRIPLGAQPPDVRGGLCMLLREMKGVAVVKRLMSGTWTFSGAGKGWGDAKVPIWRVWGVLLACKGAARSAGRTNAAGVWLRSREFSSFWWPWSGL